MYSRRLLGVTGPGPTAADAVMAMAETVLAHGPAAFEGAERYQAVALSVRLCV